MNLNTLLGLPGKEMRDNQKIIVLVPEAAKGNNVGIIVDDVSSVRQVPETDIENIGTGISSEFSQFVKGIIKISGDDAEKKRKDLIIWLDMEKVLADLATGQKAARTPVSCTRQNETFRKEEQKRGIRMTEQRPGRKALFVGAPAPAGRNSPDEIAQHVRQLNEEIALALKGAAAKKAVKPLEASHFGSEYTTLVDAVNTALARRWKAVAIRCPGTPAGTPAAGTEEYEKKIDVLERRLEFMEKNNPVPMLIATPSFDIIEANAAYLAMSGIPESEILKTNIHDFAITGRSGEGAKVALEKKRRAVGELTVTFPSGVHTLEQYLHPGA